MKEIAEKLTQVERDLAEEKGQFLLFALFLREDAPNLWDLIVSASWIIKNKKQSIKYIFDRIKQELKVEELLKLSRIVVIEKDNLALEALQRNFHVEHGILEIQDSNFFGLQIKHGYIITSRRGD